MTRPSALVLARDMTNDGSGLGPNSKLRVLRAFEHWLETGEQLVFAAPRSPRHDTKTSLGQMMANLLETLGCEDYRVVTGTRFNTRGEIEGVELASDIELRSIIAAPWHLKRVALIVEQLCGPERLAGLNLVESDDPMSFQDWLWRERAKRMFIRHVPVGRQAQIFNGVTRVTTKLGINLSY